MRSTTEKPSTSQIVQICYIYSLGCGRPKFKFKVNQAFGDKFKRVLKIIVFQGFMLPPRRKNGSIFFYNNPRKTSEGSF